MESVIVGIEPTKAECDHANEVITFTIECTMKRRWAAQFLGALKQMRWLGSVGSSREVAIFADGDGDFRPKFKWDAALPIAEPVKTRTNGDTFFDAG